MAVREVTSGLYQLSKGGVNAFIIDDGDDGLTLIDAGYPKHAGSLEEDIRSLGHDRSDLRRVVLTHGHPDHLGSAKHFAQGGLPIHMHEGDAHLARAGFMERTTFKPAPGVVNKILFYIVTSKRAEYPAFEPDVLLNHGDVLDIGGGLEVIHTPGHTAGHLCFLWKRDRGLLITGDAAANMMGLNYVVGYDDIDTGKTSLAKLAQLDFEAAVFGHGKPILSGASTKFASKFG
jgi:glyoxylase-like metal-dependent hydrolase (beta-lactamase superfamily II)